jgi:REP element-mobilizing transposase RayT
MTSSLLIVTPQVTFGSLLRNGLDSTRLDAFSTSDFSESVLYVRKKNCDFVILDTELENVELSVMDIGFALRQIKPTIQFILVVSPGQELDADSLSPVATLTKPISLPDLEKLLEKLSTPDASPLGASSELAAMRVEQTPSETTQLTWLKDVSKVAQHLTRLTLESSAQAALITRQNELWAYAGQLSREAAMELTGSIQRYWDAEAQSDLLRFVRLQATEAQHMLYARKLSEELILALVFDAETPFSTIRSQAGKLVKSLSESSFVEMGKTVAPVPVADVAAPVLPSVLDTTDTDDDEEDDILPISELLGDVPPPIPLRISPKSDQPWNQSSTSATASRMAVDEPITTPPLSLKVEGVAQTQFSLESSPPIRRESVKRPVPAMDETFASPIATTELDVSLDIGEFELSADMQMTRKQDVRKDRVPDSVFETRPQVVAESMTEAAHHMLLEPASPSLVNLTYACLLLPRFDHHHLVGDFAARLNDWVPQNCVAFGWRLEHLSVRPDYLQWVVRVPPSTAPGYIMRIIRQQTSDRIFSEFPRFKVENPSGDFWAPGYLIMGSSQVHPQKLVRDFIKQTRARQGLGLR